MTHRINARLDPGLARKIRILSERTGQTKTEILTASLEAYVAAAEVKGRPAALLADLIGCATGPADLSENYKEQLTQLLRRKHRA
jgi:hypothetical protein